MEVGMYCWTRKAIRSEAEEHTLPGAIIRPIMTKSLSTNWQDYRVEGNVSEGCPQGGVLSPLLWSFLLMLAISAF